MGSKPDDFNLIKMFVRSTEERSNNLFRAIYHAAQICK